VLPLQASFVPHRAPDGHAFLRADGSAVVGAFLRAHGRAFLSADARAFCVAVHDPDAVGHPIYFDADDARPDAGADDVDADARSVDSGAEWDADGV